ncbi:Uncharacterised protein [Clostridioides difficile]|uniref:DUF1281 family ferredoxin-like fold protein n=1 Tax=Clostridioides difficile TaxID=1496 RepID=UPI00097FFC3C|nr:hypothetical protein [Clostridioides difficile]SJP64178.1 Uncharacterised protein [Clostridioides difficile]
MPNYITNRLVIKGEEKEINEVLEFIKVDELGIGSIDFNKITPAPKWLCKRKLGREAIEEYGEENCLDEWNRKHWGTKWNAFEQKDRRSTENIIYFTTVWGDVSTLIQKIAWIFPCVEIEYSWCDENFGYNLGRYRFKDTKILEEYLPSPCTKQAYDLALNITQGTAEDYDLKFNEETNEYEHIEEW